MKRIHFLAHVFACILAGLAIFSIMVFGPLVARKLGQPELLVDGVLLLAFALLYWGWSGGSQCYFIRKKKHFFRRYPQHLNGLYIPVIVFGGICLLSLFLSPYSTGAVDSTMVFSLLGAVLLFCVLLWWAESPFTFNGVVGLHRYLRIPITQIASVTCSHDRVSLHLSDGGELLVPRFYSKRVAERFIRDVEKLRHDISSESPSGGIGG